MFAGATPIGFVMCTSAVCAMAKLEQSPARTKADAGMNTNRTDGR
jgi:hypothetical protein